MIIIIVIIIKIAKIFVTVSHHVRFTGTLE